MADLIPYDILQTIWFFLWGLLWAMYFILDGFDLGMGTLLPFIARTEKEKRIIYNASGPFWDANEVWLITAGGVTFAAFPHAYAVMFSALYTPLLLLLFSLIFRAVTFEFRGKVESDGWRKVWDVCQFLGSLLPALLLGVAFANLFMGIPIKTINGHEVFMGNLFDLLGVYGLAGGVLFVVIFAFHGSLWLGIRSVGEMHDKALKYARVLWVVQAVLAVVFLLLTYSYTSLYANYFRWPVLFAIPALAVVCLLLQPVFLAKGKVFIAFLCSALFILFVTFFGVTGMFPNIIASNIAPEFSVTMSMAASSPLTLTIMLVVALIFVPIVLVYQGFVYYMFSFKITDEVLESKHAY